MGFNGEVIDPLTGHYLLGNGHRAFNPVLMRFNSPDSLSPFGRGGLNPYAYCLGDPVNFSDPTGKISEINLIGIIFSGVVLATSLITLAPAVPFLLAKNAIAGGVLTSGQSVRTMVGAVSGALAGPMAVVGAAAGVARAVIQEVDPDSPALKYLAWTSLIAGSTALLARGGSYWAARDPKTIPALKGFERPPAKATGETPPAPITPAVGTSMGQRFSFLERTNNDRRSKQGFSRYGQDIRKH
ncbi:RHS repeat-associated core domain-containing protein [Pseudomonas sp. NPDC089569]|uniref:RHS repeat-associated core domain-containing protein n=1 Tax=Pseudomonas sp. NPDC089569 TaxID=3390722 RepID=UPI003CFE0048